MQHDIQYIKRTELDTIKWDDCIKKAENGLVYGYAWWLDVMADNWDALVLNDYEAVMPLTWRKKYGFFYLYQPAFTANLGMFYKREAGINIAAFLKVIPSHFRLWDISLNEMNRLNTDDYKGIQIVSRKNMLVSNQQTLTKPATSYARLAKRKLKLAAQNSIVVDRNGDVESAIAFYKQEYQHQHLSITQKDYDNLIKACTSAFMKGHSKCYVSKRDNKILGAYIILKDERYFYSLIGGSTKDGKELGAFYMLTDAAIQDAAGEKCSFRFEGSDISGIAFFNSQFGPREIAYTHLKLNRLPRVIKLLKKLQ